MEVGAAFLIRPATPLTVKNTIVANSTGGNCAGDALNSNGHNLDRRKFLWASTPDRSNHYQTRPWTITMDNGGPTFTQKLRQQPARKMSGPAVRSQTSGGIPGIQPPVTSAPMRIPTKIPIPAITTLVPNSRPAGGSAFTLTVNGYTYGSSEMVVLWLEIGGLLEWEPQTNDLCDQIQAYSRNNRGRPGRGRNSPGHGF